MSRLDSANSKHKENGKRLYSIWHSMKKRCNTESDTNYHSYGGRGISVCEEWHNDFTTFYDWSIANGYTGSLTLDRKDVNGNYEPSNCEWATPIQQSNNRRDNNLVTINGETKTVVEWEREYGLPRDTVRRRVNAGYSESELLLPPIKATKKSGVKGVTWRKDIEKWCVRDSNGKAHGNFEKLDDAISKRSEVE